MNKTKIEWCTHTWNPITGCRHGCEYCYACRIANRFNAKAIDGNPRPDGLHVLEAALKSTPFPFGFEPTLHRYRLDQPERAEDPRTVFVCSMADLFGEWVPDEWINEVFVACEKAPQHRYLFLTKNPKRYMELNAEGKLPEKNNFWYGTSTPTPSTMFWSSDHHNTFVSIEPMLEPFPSDGDCVVKKVNWILLGAMTGPGSKAHQPKKEWVESLVEDAMASVVPVFMKDSLIPIVGEKNMIRDFPWEGQRK